MPEKFTREEMCYEDALTLIEKSLAGKVVSNSALRTAIDLMGNGFVSIFLDRREAAKKDSDFPDEIGRDIDD